MKKKVLDIIGMIIISIVITVFSVIIGANEKALRTLPMCILLFIICMYLIIRKIMLKQKIVVKNKIDLFVLLFMCSTILPLIFRTYCTLQGTIEFILKYFFVYAMYLVVRNTIDTTKKVNVLTSVTIISSFIVIIFGIDLQHKQYLKEIINKLNLNYSEDTRFSSTFGYANTVAIYITFCMFLALHKIQNSKNKIIKVLNIFYIILGFYIVYITISRAVLLLLLFGLILWFIIYYYKYIIKNKKTIIIFSSVFIVITITLVCILLKGINYSKPLEIDNEYENYLRYEFEANKEYEIKLEINTVNTQNNEKAEPKDIKIELIEENIYRNDIPLASEQIKNYNDTLTLKITPDSNYLRIRLGILTNNEKIIIKKCYINNEEYILNHKYIPNQIARLLKSFKLKEGSIDQRLVFYKDSIKIAKNNWLIGQGGNTWKKLSYVVQEYAYNIKETHSYLFELLISYGITGVLLFLAVFLGINIKLIKEYINNINQESKSKLAILIGLDILILHSLFFDFNMSFLIINLLVFMYIAVLMYNEKDFTQNQKTEGIIKYENIIDYITLIFLVIVFITLTCASIAQYCIKDQEIKKKLLPYNSTYRFDYINLNIRDVKKYEKTLAEIQKLMKDEPYYKQNELYSHYWSLIMQNKMNIEANQLADYLEFINNQYTKVKMATPMQINTIMPRVKDMVDAYIELKEMNYSNEKVLNQIERLKQIIQNEYKTNIVNIKDKDRNGLNQEQIDRIKKEYEKTISLLFNYNKIEEGQ